MCRRFATLPSAARSCTQMPFDVESAWYSVRPSGENPRPFVTSIPPYSSVTVPSSSTRYASPGVFGPFRSVRSLRTLPM